MAWLRRLLLRLLLPKPKPTDPDALQHHLKKGDTDYFDD